jgi:pantoate--beta-alanine ligase
VEPVPGLLELSLAGGYERDGEADLALARSAGVDIVFIPERRHMYPDVPVRTRVVPDDDLAAPWENAENPEFIRMTATAVLKYWNIVGPCRHYFGEKDWVPLAVLRKMIADFSVPAELVSCPIVRESDGVCVSSRNRKLSERDRAAAPVLYAAIREAIDLVGSGERDGAVIRDLLRTRVGTVAAVDYAEIVDAASLRRVDPLVGDLRVLVGAEFSGVHLFDNAPVSV